MKYAVTLTNGVTGKFEASNKDEARAKAWADIEQYAEANNIPIPEELRIKTVEATEDGV